MKVIEPATEKVLAEVAEASVEDADRAVARAKAAFPKWSAVSPGDRAQLLRRLAAAVEKEAEKLAQLEARNVGKPISDARGEVGMVVSVFNYYAGAPERLLGDTIPVAGGVNMTFR
ncbi:MAG TPA: aldehyde dehydrogenase family protein, partial [Candidatus Dormibacteraeota bacterium]